MEKHFLKLLDFTPAEIQQFLDTAADLKAKKKAGTKHAGECIKCILRVWREIWE